MSRRRVVIFSKLLRFFRFSILASAAVTESTSDSRARSRAISEPTFPQPTTRTFKFFPKRRESRVFFKPLTNGPVRKSERSLGENCPDTIGGHTRQKPNEFLLAQHPGDDLSLKIHVSNLLNLREILSDSLEEPIQRLV